MNDIRIKMAGGKTVKQDKSKIMSKIKRKTGSGLGRVALGGEETEGQKRGARSRDAEERPDRARRPSPMIMPVIDVRELSDEMPLALARVNPPLLTRCDPPDGRADGISLSKQEFFWFRGGICQGANCWVS